MQKISVTHHLFLALVALALQACSGADNKVPAFNAVDTTVMSRGVEIPVTFTGPTDGGDQRYPLVVMAHGHGGSRHEAGGYTQLAEALAARGIASVRMDFPGCGDSSESFANNNLSNMLEDIRVSRDFALQQPQVDASRVGLHGYSMGGRLAILTAAADESYVVIGTWAPAGQNGAASMIEFLGGPDAYSEFKARAAAEGYVPFTTAWGQDQQLGLQFFNDMEDSKPLDVITNINAPLLVLYGDKDDVVVPAVAEAVVSAAINSSEVIHHVIKGADHGLGIFSEEPHYTEEAVSTTADFFEARL